MVVVSHLFFFLWKKLVRGAAHMSRPSHYLELSISRQPPSQTIYQKMGVSVTLCTLFYNKEIIRSSISVKKI